jgi:NNP family nitrate/nitrite transporter-like MFS transporter
VKPSPYRWVILALAWLVIFFVNYSWYVLPPLEEEFSSSLGLSTDQIYLLLTAPTLAAALSSLPGGTVGDRLGVRRTVLAGILLGSAVGTLRALSTGFPLLLFLTFLVGASMGLVVPNLPKMVGEWFPEGERGAASGIYVSSMGLGISAGLFSGALFPSWKWAFLCTGAGMLLSSLLWLSLAREPPGGRREGVPLRESLFRATRSRNVWLLAFSYFLFMGAFVSYTGGLTHAVQEVFGVEAEEAGALSALAVVGMVVGNLLWPPLADRTGRFRGLLILCSLLSGPLLFFAWLWSYGYLTWVLVFVGGLMAGGIPPLLLAYPPLLPEVGARYSGGAGGMILTSGNLGGITVMMALFSPLSKRGYDPAFLFLALFFSSIALLAVFLSRVGKSRA